MNFLILHIFIDFILIFQGFFRIYFLLKKHEKGFYICTGPTKLTWHDANTWQSHARPRGPRGHIHDVRTQLG